MKKRLLSALLALVMVLAMLPATAFADDSDQIQETQDAEEDAGSTPVEDEDDPVEDPPAFPVTHSIDTDTPVEHKTHNNPGTTNSKGQSSGVVTGAPGYYAKTTVDGCTIYTKIDNGIVVGNKYKGSSVSLSSGTAIVIGSGNSVDITGTTATVDLYGSDASATITSSGGKLTNLTVTDSKYYGVNETRATKASVSLPSFDTSKAITLNLTSVSVSDLISFTGVNAARTIKLENADVSSGITLEGKDSEGKKPDAKMQINVNQDNSNNRRTSELGEIRVTGNSAVVNLVDVYPVSGAAPAVELDGTSTQLTIGGNSTIGAVTLKDHLTNNAATTQLSKVTVGGNVTVASIKTTGDAHAGKVQVTVNRGVNVTGDIDLTTANTGLTVTADVDVSAATVGGLIKVNGGTVDVKDAATVSGGLVIDGATTFKVTGTGNTVYNIAALGSQASIDVPADPDNTFSVGSGGSGLNTYVPSSKVKAIAGGTWSNQVPAAALSTTLVYQLSNNGKFTYYTADQLATALTAQEKNSGTAVLCRTSDNANAGNSYNLVFMNGKTRWGTMKIYGEVQIKLPTAVNNVTITKWADARRSYDAGGMYPTPAVGGTDGALKDSNWEINASGGVTSGDITKLTSVTTTWNTTTVNQDEMGIVKASLNNTVITLTGAVPKGDSSLTLHLTTDAVEKDKDDANKEVPVVLDVRVNYWSSTKSLNFANVQTDLGHGATLQTDAAGLTTLRLSNGTKYTLNGSGLKERSNKIKVAAPNSSNDISGYPYIEVSVQGISSTYKTIEAQEEIVNLIKGAGASFDWSSSPAMQEAVNAALATITDANVDSYITNAQSAAWKTKNQGTYNAATNGPQTGYNEVWLVPYLQVNLTNYVPGTTVTATLVPSWRVEVRQRSVVSDYQYAFKNTKKFDQPDDAYIAKAGTSLGALTGEFGSVKVKFSGLMETVSSGNWGSFNMHQDSTYVYAHSGDDGYVIDHVGTGSNGLGTVVINKTGALIWRYRQAPATGIQGRYDTLQAAVDDTKDGEHILVDQNYKGSMTINVTGTARTFTILSEGNNVVVANVSNGLVDMKNTGGLYTIQLTRDATAVGATTADINVATGVINGTVTLSTTRARANTSVEVTTTPAAGYLTRNLTATARTADNKNTAVAVTRTADNKYTFTVPAGATSITVTPTFAINTGLPFTDIAADNSYFEAVKYVYNRGMMQGEPAANGTTVFNGYSTITRGQVVTILYRLSGSPTASTYSGFSDVPSNQYYAAPITWAYSNGIVDGIGNGQFAPNTPITREQLAKILREYSVYRGLNITKTTSLAGYSDAGSVHDWAQAGMQWAVGNGIVTGTTTTTLTPGGNAQRYHAATMLMRYCNSFGL